MAADEVLLKSLVRQYFKANGKPTKADLDELTRKIVSLALNPGWIENEPEQFKAKKTSWTIAELFEAEFPEPRWAIPGIIPEGLTVLAGRPKIGKSWLTLQISHAVGTGGIVLGQKVNQGKVLHLALEDSARRLKTRTEKQNFPRNTDVLFETRWELLSEGGLSKLQTAITTEKYTLVIVDTLSRAIGGSDQMDAGTMNVIMSNLHETANELGIAIILVDHHRKKGLVQNNDPIEDIFGSTGKSGPIDCAVGLYRDRGKSEAILKTALRDNTESELALLWDGQLCCWQSLGPADDVRKDSFKGEIISAMKELKANGETATCTSIAKFIGAQRSNVSTALGELWTLGKVKKGDKTSKEVPYELP